MDGNLQLFQNEEFGKLEVLIIDGKPHFPATDIAKILGYTNPRKAIIDHCKGVTNRYSPTNGGKQAKKYIPEGDLYRLIIRSKLPSAERFERWVFDEVLPAIRQHGAYIAPDTLKQMLASKDFSQTLLQALADEQAARRAVTEELLDEQEYSELLEDELAEAAPKAEYLDRILQCSDTIPVSLIAKEYGMSAAMFNKLLHALEIQYRLGGTWVLYQRHSGKGYTAAQTYWVNQRAVAVHTYWTQKGRVFLYDTLKGYGIVPCCEYIGISQDAMQGRR